MPLRTCILRSGSHANCTAIWDDDDCILIDCSRFDFDADKGEFEVENELKGIGIRIPAIRGLFITHAHSDHVDDGAMLFATRHKIPVYGHEKTFEVVRNKFRKAKYDESIIRHLDQDRIMAGKFLVKPFRTHHWKEKPWTTGVPMGFIIQAGTGESITRIGYVTDTKKISSDIFDALTGIGILFIEANYSEEQVAEGEAHPGYKEHLSNLDAARTIAKLEKASPGALEMVFLAHISDSNNTCKRAISEVGTFLTEKKISVPIHPTYRKKRTEVFEL